MYKWSLKYFSELYVFTYQQDMYSKTGKKNFRNKPEELLQPQNKAKQHSLRLCHLPMRGVDSVETLSTAVTCFYFQNQPELLDIHSSAL